jgi:hypothetical protein
MKYQVVPYMVWAHPAKIWTASSHGCAPIGDGWEIVQRGFTVFNPNTNEYGAMQPPWTTAEAAQVWADSHRPNTVSFSD